MQSVVRQFSKHTHFNYDVQGKNWKIKAGKEQSPVPLELNKAVKSVAPRLNFINYNKRLRGPLKLINNGHTVTMNIPTVDDGTHPSICGCKLASMYKAVQLHFHWGSPESKGSEHTINSTRFDVELHILHQNYAYVLHKDAISSPDGFVVLAIMLRSVANSVTSPPFFNAFCDELKNVIDYNKTATIGVPFCLRDILIGLDRREFFTYKGSLTTPPCAEVVNWFVFSSPIDVSEKCLQQFWLLKDERGQPLLNNYRALQRLHERPVFLRNEIGKI